MATPTASSYVVISGEPTTSSSASGALPSDGGSGCISFAAPLGDCNLTNGEKFPHLPQTTSRASSSFHDIAAAGEVLPVPAPLSSPPTPNPASIASTSATGDGAPILGNSSTTSDGNPSEFIILSKGLATMGGGLVKVLTAFGLIDAQKENTKEKSEEHKEDEPDQEQKTPKRLQGDQDNEHEQGQVPSKRDLENQTKKPEQKQEQVKAKHSLSRFYDLTAQVPGYVNKAAMLTEGIAEIVNGFHDSRNVIGPWIPSLRSAILSGLEDSIAVAGPILSSLRSRISPDQEESKMQSNPRRFRTGHMGLQALLSPQIVTRYILGRSIIIDDIYGRRRFETGVRIIENKEELRTTVAQFKNQDLIQKIDVQQGSVSLDEALSMWLYIQAEGATFLLKHDSVLTSSVLKATFIMDNLNSVEAHLARTQSMVEELKHSKETLAARLNEAAGI